MDLFNDEFSFEDLNGFSDVITHETIFNRAIFSFGSNIVVTTLIDYKHAYNIAKLSVQNIRYGFDDLMTPGTLGLGIYCYIDETDYVLHKASEENLVRLQLDIDTKNIINQLVLEDYNKIKNLAHEIKAKTDDELYSYIGKNKTKEFSGYIYTESEGKPLFKESSIREFTGRKLVIYNTHNICNYSLLD